MGAYAPMRQSAFPLAPAISYISILSIYLYLYLYPLGFLNRRTVLVGPTIYYYYILSKKKPTAAKI